MTNKQIRVFSGVQPSGDPQLGNYLGAFRGWVKKQSEKDNFFCIVDLHALTVTPSPEDLKKQTRELAAVLFACGIDPDQSTLFVQSHVSAHAEGCWLLNCVTPIGWLERMTQFKDKSEGKERVSTGLLDYPVLMAGDILLYDADEVPVGEDQKQHVELSRDIAERFNRLYGETFKIPQPVIPEVGGRVMGLNDPNVKMSKSFSDIRGHAVRILDEPKEIERSFMRAVTDSSNEIVFSNSPEKAGVNNLLGIYKVITEKSEEEVEKDFASARGYGDLKKAVAEVVIEELRPIREKYFDLIQDVSELDRLLSVGAHQASSIAFPKLDQMKEKMGLVLPISKE
ncbi:MAG: tryptophan--tRNA ligase [Dehalococcoidia bacterium]